MIKQPKWGKRNVTRSFYEMEAANIETMNTVFQDVDLNSRENQILVWIAGQDETVVHHLLTAVLKAAKSSAGKKPTKEA